MAKYLRRLVTLTFVVMFLLPHVMGTEGAQAANASSKITIFNQFCNSDSSHWPIAKLKLGGGATNMKTSGCGIYSMMHIIQWCTNKGNGIKLSVDEGVALANEMISVCNVPYDYLPTSKYSGVAADHGVKKVSAPDKSDKSAIKTHFDKGGAVFLHEANWGSSSGHYICAVGYVEHDVNGDGTKDFLIRIVDSAVSSSAKRFKYKGYAAYRIDTYKALGDGWYGGGEYFVPLEVYQAFGRQMGYLPSGYYSKFTTVDSTPRIAKSVKAKTGDTTDDQCYLKAEPYEASTTKDVAEKGEIIYLSGSVKNSHGNLWYQTEEGSFIWKGDIEILEPNITNKSETAYSAVGVSKNSDCYLKDKAYEAAAHSKTIAKGKTVEIVAKVVNYHGNTWYKTADGKYVYSGDVTTYECTELFDISAKFRNTEKRDSHAAPYTTSPDVKSYAKDAEVTATRFVVNSYGNIWAQLSDGSYLCFYDFDSGENKLKYVGTMAAVTVSEVKKPTGDLKVGASFGIRGVLTSNVPFYRVSSHVIDRKAQDYALDKVTVYPSMTTRTVNLNKKINGTNINEITYFSKLPQGYYRYAVTAWMGFTYNGKTFNFGSDTVVIESEFTVGSPTEDVVLPDVRPSGITFSAGGDLTGSVNGTVTVPIFFNNPNGTVLEMIELAYNLPAGVTVSKVVAAQGDVQLTTPTTFIADVSDGIVDSGKVMDVTFALDGTVTFPLNITMTPTVYPRGTTTNYKLSSFAVTISGTNSSRVPGDANEDGKVNARDSMAILKYVSGWDITINLSNADVNGDGKANARDSLAILKYVSGWDVVLK